MNRVQSEVGRQGIKMIRVYSYWCPTVPAADSWIQSRPQKEQCYWRLMDRDRIQYCKKWQSTLEKKCAHKFLGGFTNYQFLKRTKGAMTINRPQVPTAKAYCNVDSTSYSYVIAKVLEDGIMLPICSGRLGNLVGVRDIAKIGRSSTKVFA